MQAWILEQPGQPLVLRDVPQPDVRPGVALVRMEAVPLLSYTRAYLDGKLPYAYPPVPFTPGTNGVGRIVAVGPDVQHFRAGQRVLVHPYWAAGENVSAPAQILIGLTGVSDDSAGMQQIFPHGTWREVVDVPASTLVSLDGLEHESAERLAALARFAVPFGGLRRGALVAGETVVINGASGAFGSAAVLAALAMGAEKVVALGRRVDALQRLMELANAQGRGRVVPIGLSGDVRADAEAIRRAAGGDVDFGFDMVGQARDAAGTLAALHSLRRGGRLVLMGSMQVPLPIPYGEMLRNNWSLIGHFMYAPADYRALVALVRAGLLRLDAIDAHAFPFARMEEAIDAAGTAGSLEAAVVTFGAGA